MLYTKSAAELHALFMSGEVSAVTITSCFLDRIAQYDGKIGAFLSVFSDSALARAHELDKRRAAGEKMGKLAGVPVAIKDNIHIKGELTTCASKFLENYTAPFSATASELLWKEDAIFIGKTNMDEFAMGGSNTHSAMQPTWNPWNLKCVPGGSSGGSAAAVAARMAPLALGSETGGSVRLPAAFCGISGIKPTYGRVSRYGLVAFGSSLDQISPFAHKAEDIALIMDVIGKHCAKDATSVPTEASNCLAQIKNLPKHFKIGVPREQIDALSTEAKAQFNKFLDDVRSLGAEVVDIKLNTLKYTIATYYILSSAEASTNLARFDGIRYGKRSERAKTLEQIYEYSKADGFGSEVKRRILLGTFVLSSGCMDAFYRKAQKVRTLMIGEYNKAFTQCNYICLPTAPQTAFEPGSIKDPMQEYLVDIFTCSANLVGLPAMSVPNGFINGLPFGAQIVAPLLHEAEICQLAYALQSKNNDADAMPEWLHQGGV